MNKQFIKDNERTFKKIRGKHIIKCFRLFFESDLEYIPENIRWQEADGVVFLVFSNGEIISFYPNSENFTVKMEKIKKEKLPNGLLEVSNNQFWNKRVNSEIISVELIYGYTDTPYGVLFQFANGLKMDLCYLSESEYTFDALIISNGEKV